jgi:hypothetical protein
VVLTKLRTENMGLGTFQRTGQHLRNYSEEIMPNAPSGSLLVVAGCFQPESFYYTWAMYSSGRELPILKTVGALTKE